MMMTTMTRFRFEGYAGEKKEGEERKGMKSERKEKEWENQMQGNLNNNWSRNNSHC